MLLAPGLQVHCCSPGLLRARGLEPGLKQDPAGSRPGRPRGLWCSSGSACFCPVLPCPVASKQNLMLSLCVTSGSSCKLPTLQSKTKALE